MLRASDDVKATVMASPSLAHSLSLLFDVMLAVAIVGLTSILIISMKKQTTALLFFTNPKVVYVGLISYSLYLWHWGVLSISRFTIGIHWWSIPFQFLLIFGLAVVSYRYIEIPLRKGNSFGDRWKTFFFGGGVLVTLSGCIIALNKTPNGILYLGNFREAIKDDYSVHFPATRKECDKEYYSKSIGEHHIYFL